MSQMLTGEHGIALYVKDLEESSSWYCRHLGFTLGPHDFHDFVELHLNGKNVLHLFKSDSVSPMTQPYFGLYINDAELLHKSLKDKGLQVTAITRHSDHMEFLFSDPDGNVIGMTQWLSCSQK